jgi:DNA-binding beta-propeller fold protein YncE
MYEEPVDVQGLKVPAADVRNIAFNGHTKKLFALGNDSKQLKEIPFNEKGLPVPGSSATQSYKLDGVDLQAASGITFDPATGRMFVLNAKGDQLVVTPDPASGLGTGANASTISLKALQANSLQGIAFNPQDGHLYLPDSTSQRLYELTQDGKKISEYDLSSLGLSGPKTLVFAPSVDRTDDPSTMNLFLLDSGKSSAESAKIVELSLQARGSLPGGTPILPASLVRVQNINNTVWDPS